jgi:hypothetical protein
MLNFTEDAHIKSMSTFETDEHLQTLTPSTCGARIQINGLSFPSLGSFNYPGQGAVADIKLIEDRT